MCVRERERDRKTLREGWAGGLGQLSYSLQHSTWQEVKEIRGKQQRGERRGGVFWDLMLTPWLLRLFWVSYVWASANKGIVSSLLASSAWFFHIPNLISLGWLPHSETFPHWFAVKHSCILIDVIEQVNRYKARLHVAQSLANPSLFWALESFPYLARALWRLLLSPHQQSCLHSDTDLADKAAWLRELPVSSWQPMESPGSRWVITHITAKKGIDRDLPISRRMEMTAQLQWKARI